MRLQSFDWHEAGLTVSQVAQRSGASPSALRFYERKGLIASDRTAGNQRRYRGDVLCRVAMIRACQQVGLSIAEIGSALAELPEDHIPGPEDWERLSKRLKREVINRMDELSRVLGALSQATPAQAGPGQTAPAQASQPQPVPVGATANVAERA